MNFRRIHLIALTLGLGLAHPFAIPVLAEEERHYDQAHSRSPYIHHIDLYDAKGKIDPDAENPRPYSPAATCIKCHNYDAISHGWHFNAGDKGVDAGRPGEPWLWTNRRAGTQIPLSFRGWPGTYRPEEVGLTPEKFLQQFGRQLPGGGIGERIPAPPSTKKKTQDTEDKKEPAAPDDTSAAPAKPKPGDPQDLGRWKISGQLNVDCMICHTGSRGYRHEDWAQQISQGNFAWAPAVAIGLAKVTGSAKSLPDDFDPEAQDAAARLPRTSYDKRRFDADKKVFFDIIRKPTNNACYTCHTVRPSGESAAPRWQHDQDVHIKAGLSCVDCHRNGIGHHTVRGFENEAHPTGQKVATLSCRGCHMDNHDKGAASGGRLGAPKPLHKGLPPLHFDKLSCTVCHSGPLPGKQALPLQTSFSHALGLALDRQEQDPPSIVSPVFKKKGRGVLYPYRMTWPAFWGAMKDGRIKPLNSDLVYARALRRPFRMKSGDRTLKQLLMKVTLTDEERIEVLNKDRAAVEPDKLTAMEQWKLKAAKEKKAEQTFREKLVAALKEIKKRLIEDEDTIPVYVAGGKLYQLDEKQQAVVTSKHKAAEPYAWALAHDVRPARWSLGAKGCTECHAPDAPIFYSKAIASAPIPDTKPVAKSAYELQGLDKPLLEAWEQSFKGRSAFKVFAGILMGLVALVLTLYVLLAINGVVKRAARAKDRATNS